MYCNIYPRTRISPYRQVDFLCVPSSLQSLVSSFPSLRVEAQSGSLWLSLARPLDQKCLRGLKAKLFCPSKQLDHRESICRWQQLSNHWAILHRGRTPSAQPARSLCFCLKFIPHLCSRSVFSATCPWSKPSSQLWFHSGGEEKKRSYLVKYIRSGTRPWPWGQVTCHHLSSLC